MSRANKLSGVVAHDLSGLFRSNLAGGEHVDDLRILESNEGFCRIVPQVEHHQNDLAGGKMPSDDLGENAAWWWTMILALNLNNIMKGLALDKEWKPVRLKAIRFRLLNLPGLVVEHARRLLVKLSCSHPSFPFLCWQCGKGFSR